MVTKDEAARRLIDWHFEVEPELCEVYRIIVDGEAADGEPIKLLEVTAATVATGSVEPFGFTGTDEIPYRTVIAEITPDELAMLRTHPDKLPRGWSLDRAMRFPRPSKAA